MPSYLLSIFTLFAFVCAYLTPACVGAYAFQLCKADGTIATVTLNTLGQAQTPEDASRSLLPPDCGICNFTSMLETAELPALLEVSVPVVLRQSLQVSGDKDLPAGPAHLYEARGPPSA